MTRTIVILLIVALIAVLPAGCSPGDSSGGAVKDTAADKNAVFTQLIEPEQLIVKEEAEELLGAAVANVQKSEQEVVGQKQCLYEFAGEASDRFLQVSLTQRAFIKNQNAEVTPKFIFESIKDNFEAELVAIDGIGEEAFITTPGIHILQGDYYIVIAVGNTSNETNRDILKAAGAKAVRNLEQLTNK